MQPIYDITSERLTRYVFENVTHGLTLSDMARHMHMNRTYASEIFRQTTGLTFSECLTRARISHAKLLLRGNDKLCAVALESGFGSEVNFYRVFRRVTGMTPGEYRAAHFRQEYTAKESKL